MKKILLLIVTMITLTAKAQTSVYHPFPDSNAYWCQYAQWYDGLCDHLDNSTVYFGTDTLINGNIYHTLKKSGYTYSSLCGGGGYYSAALLAAIRQDTLQHKVFMYDNSIAGDVIFYDFNLQVGDTLNSTKVNWGNIGTPCIVTSIDSILINGQYRKRFNHTGSSGCPDSSIIEGIGSVSGLMSAPSGCFESFNWITSFEQNGIGMYPDSAASCVIISAIENVLVNDNIHIYPNPVSDKLNVTLNNNQPSEIVLYDIASRKLFKQSFINSTSINTSHLAKGIYFYEVSNINGVIKKGKVVKQ